jgi:anti-anti-sigma factor
MNSGKHNSPSRAVHFELRKDSESRCILELSGKLDMDSAPRLWRELKQKLATTHMATLEINTAGLTHYDSTGLGLLYFVSKAQMTPDAQVTLSELKPELEKALGAFSMEDYQAFQKPTAEKSIRGRKCRYRCHGSGE